ncbi:MAG TPA: alkaline shock response membrane anchor protein AmaP [Thermaerobacter sp.]
MAPRYAVLAVLNSAVLAILGLAMVAAALGEALLPGADPFASAAALAPQARWYVAGAGLAFVLSGVHVVHHALCPRRRDALSAATELGEVRTALAAVEELARRSGLQVGGIRDVRPRVRADRDGVRLWVRAEVLPDHPIPEVAPRLQARLRETVEAVVGARVKEVRVVVERFAGERHRRAE